MSNNPFPKAIFPHTLVQLPPRRPKKGTAHSLTIAPRKCLSCVPDHCTSYSKMAENTLFLCPYVNWALLFRIKPKILLISAGAIETMRAN